MVTLIKEYDAANDETRITITARIAKNSTTETVNTIRAEYMQTVKDQFGSFQHTSHNVYHNSRETVLSYVGYIF